MRCRWRFLPRPGIPNHTLNLVRQLLLLMVKTLCLRFTKVCILFRNRNIRTISFCRFTMLPTERKPTAAADIILFGDTVILDFNKAYQPYCAYNAYDYSCPIVPAENTLPVAVKAGVRYEDVYFIH